MSVCKGTTGTTGWSCACVKTVCLMTARTGPRYLALLLVQMHIADCCGACASRARAHAHTHLTTVIRAHSHRQCHSTHTAPRAHTLRLHPRATALTLYVALYALGHTHTRTLTLHLVCTLHLHPQNTHTHTHTHVRCPSIVQIMQAEAASSVDGKGLYEWWRNGGGHVRRHLFNDPILNKVTAAALMVCLGNA
jgi:hypothetical protein